MCRAVGVHFFGPPCIGSSANFRTVLSESRPETTTHQLPSRKQILTQNYYSGSFKVIYFGTIEEPLRCYIAQYNKCGLRYEGSEDI